MNLQALIPDDLRDLRNAFLRRGNDLRLVGGCVRDWKLQTKSKDIDLCTDADPDQQIAIYTEDGFSFHETGLKHGTITVVLGSGVYEITSLRTETDHDGRHATVNYTRDWMLDLGRRDLTVNAMALTFDGELIDPFNGADDLVNGVIRFVGNPDDRMREDYLRILRWFRFSGRLAHHKPLDADTSAAVVRNAAGLKQISRERVWLEMAKIVSGNASAALVDSVYELGVAPFIGLPVGNVSRMAATHTRSRNPVTLMTALLGDAVIKVAADWKWSAAERDLAVFLCQTAMPDDSSANDYMAHVVNKKAPVAFVIELALLHDRVPLAEQLANMDVPVFPVVGSDLMSKGVPSGPQMGKVLKTLKDRWIASGYQLSKDDLLSEMVA